MGSLRAFLLLSLLIKLALNCGMSTILHPFTKSPGFQVKTLAHVAKGGSLLKKGESLVKLRLLAKI